MKGLMMIEYWLTKTILMWFIMKIQLMNQMKHLQSITSSKGHCTIFTASQEV